MAQWERIVVLHQTFKVSRSYRSVKELQNEIGASRATVFRLLAILGNQFGAPLLRSKKYGGYKYEEKTAFELPVLWINQDEIEALACIEHVLSNLGDGLLNDLLKPIRKRIEPILKSQNIPSGTFQKRIKIIAIGQRSFDKEIFQAVSESVLFSKKILIDYCKLGSSESVKRTVSPQTLLRYRDNWYLDAYCHSANDLRTFALSRIVSVNKLKESATTVSHDFLEEYYTRSYGIFSGSTKKIAEIRFTGVAALEIAKEIWHTEQTIQITTDDNCILHVPYSNSRELLMDILRWGSEAEVLGPPELRDEIVAIVKDMNKKYKCL